MRPDRIVVGECRSGEALDMLQAMNTGHDGSLTTIHANSPRDALSRLETLVMMAGFDLPLKAIREQIASAVTIIVQADRYKDGTRKVTNISEVTKMEGEIITMQDIFVFNHEGWTKDGKIAGRHTACGNIPTFMEEITRSKIDLDISIFRDEREGGLV
jgi:pilus assembly protein CpaF